MFVSFEPSKFTGAAILIPQRKAMPTNHVHLIWIFLRKFQATITASIISKFKDK